MSTTEIYADHFQGIALDRRFDPNGVTYEDDWFNESLNALIEARITASRAAEIASRASRIKGAIAMLEQKFPPTTRTVALPSPGMAARTDWATTGEFAPQQFSGDHRATYEDQALQIEKDWDNQPI